MYLSRMNPHIKSVKDFHLGKYHIKSLKQKLTLPDQLVINKTTCVIMIFYQSL